MSALLFTVGYEGADIAQFLATLQAVEIEHVIDIRDVPVSRKRGFSKNLLSAALGDVGIEYTHLKSLGDPKPGRDAMRQGDYEAFLRIYHSHLATHDAQEALNSALKIAESAKSVLLCYERLPKLCHRSIVAKEIGDRGEITVQHLGVNTHSITRADANLHKASIGLAYATM